ncbi:type I glyceraldehyde-3-phosphate dehydrogenase [Mycoplasma todarodis]|uniref:Glyceraldehyde-3-phosphate dehydrogenase n=1 Tax=Mycoplasma todarodis TaxID=1937191 RepID=A0A4R0XSQ1_9MOLU|nr:type I glyceraldehyde-3-phosphate dehydrogenase [Mycoplasma todarodis]TCG10629.1 type I glyceraldehyde-3-phosphate dehydrogenase [Mycoplasma todarodis]
MKKIAINGFGRIGRLVFRQMIENKNYEIVAINDLTSPAILAHLLKYDTAHGNFNGTVEATEDSLIVNGQTIKIYAERNPKDLPWAELKVDGVVESTGFFVSKEASMAHIEAGAKKVVISAPAKGDLKTVVYSVNEEVLSADDQIISAASCTTNALAPVANVLNKEFGLVKGFMTTVHAYTGDQGTQDKPHNDLRRARAGAMNIVPTTTGAAVAVGKVLPELNGKLDGIAVRVPTITGSLVDLVVELEKDVTVADINKAMEAAASDSLAYVVDPIVSSDIIGATHGTLFDSLMTKEMTEKLFKIITWYDNENSYVSQYVRTFDHFINL